MTSSASESVHPVRYCRATVDALPTDRQPEDHFEAMHYISGVVMLRDKLQAWLERPTRARGAVQIDDIPVALGTDMGLVRKDNQDVVVASRITSEAIGAGPTIVVLVADGMGGMQDGRTCACLAAASFLTSFSKQAHLPLENRMQTALREANKAVFQSVHGRGGSTIAAIAVEGSQRVVSGYVGDSRIYALRKTDGSRIERLSVGDSLEEAVGGSGRELLQFIGMGDGLIPHTSSLTTGPDALFLTTDGVHFVNALVFEKVLEQAPSSRSAIERALVLSRWCGGPDNASAASFDFTAHGWLDILPATSRFEIWDPFGQLEFIFVKENELIGTPPNTISLGGSRDSSRSIKQAGSELAESNQGSTEHHVPAKSDQRRKRRKVRPRKSANTAPQLVIEVDQEGDA